MYAGHFTSSQLAACAPLHGYNPPHARMSVKSIDCSLRASKQGYATAGVTSPGWTCILRAAQILTVSQGSDLGRTAQLLIQQLDSFGSAEMWCTGVTNQVGGSGCMGFQAVV